MAAHTIYDYMKIQNRPFSVNDVVTNLHNEYSKTEVQKAMDELVANKKLFEKVYGKQKIYCAVQDLTYDADELMTIDKELQSHAKEIESKYQEVTKEIKNKEVLLSSLKASLILEDAQKKKITLQQSIKQLTYKLDTLMETTSSVDLHESKRKAQKELDENSREYLKRKRICTDIIDCILENYPGSKNDLSEEIGLNLTTV
ncbi:homologous-pairing protein 2 homolog [Harpegnathos saltator]|uniref:Homologous-pairing protein 2 homolog n=1 Tax=Harpegnathos saltator TaxID=610380 RepID=E2C8W9_HARSA|nr:homologous-pairing protein 2 homolog [Harpegnathos saltator]EFN75613.1 Homologous-pairing protein 2-like protein [Harpegnathos saltator]